MIEARHAAAPARADALVIGGGPAGAAVARLLASWGRDVVMCTVDRPGPALAESLPPSTRKPLDAAGLLDVVERAGFMPNRGNMSWWSAGDARIERFDGLPGFQAFRPALDAVCRAAARSAGALVLDGWRVVQATPDASPPFAVIRDPAGETHRLEATVLLDCSGRAGVIARRGLRRADPVARTIALGAWFRRQGGWRDADPTYTIIETSDEGWAWSVATSIERRCAAIMLDADAIRGGSAASFAAGLAGTRRFAAMFDGASMEGSPWGVNASLYSSDCAAGPGFLLVGDAASFIDPLSSYGVKKALFSGWLAAIAANTFIGSPERAAAAAAFYRDRERDAYAGSVQQALTFYGEACEARGGAFWRRRAGMQAPAMASAEPHADPSDVQRAFDALRSAAAAQLEPGPAVLRTQGPAVGDREIVLEDRLAVRGGGSVRFIDGVDAPLVVRLAAERLDAPTLYERYCRLTAPTPLPRFLRVVATLLAMELLSIRADA
jgi:flavin-dependent dehydrogenase